LSCIAVGWKVTERRKAEEELRESEEKFRNIFESAFDVLVYLDKSGRVLDVNEKALQLFGVSRKDVVGRHFSTFGWFSTEDLPRLARIFQGTLDGRGLLTTVRVKNEEGQELDLECSASLMKADTKLLGVSVIARDITERKRMEKRLQEYAENLERLVEERTNELREAERMAAIGETAAMVGHDLRNPLQSMVNTLYLIKDRVKSMPIEDGNIVEKHGLSKFWETLADQAEYMNKIVSDLQDYARSVKHELVSTSPLGVINDALSRVRLPENVMVSTTIPEEFRELKADPVLMRRVLMNLITNAVQAMSEGGKLNIAASQTDGFASISVCDTGVGIAGEDLPKLFEPLFTTKSKGQGFGLSVCRRLVEAQGGSIMVESQVGKGSTFTVKIPL